MGRSHIRSHIGGECTCSVRFHWLRFRGVNPPVWIYHNGSDRNRLQCVVLLGSAINAAERFFWFCTIQQYSGSRRDLLSYEQWNKGSLRRRNMAVERCSRTKYAWVCFVRGVVHTRAVVRKKNVRGAVCYGVTFVLRFVTD